MADKFVTLSCRLAKEHVEDRVTRHLYDLFKLNRYLCAKNKYFEGDLIDKVMQVFYVKDKDQHRTFEDFESFLLSAKQKLKTDLKIEEDYKTFTDSISFAPDNERIAYNDTVKCYFYLTDLFKESHK